MNLNKQILKEKLCSLMCTDVNIIQKNDHLLMIDTPFYFSDGDPYQIYIKEMPAGVIRLTDMGHTLMHLSYENDINKFRDGTRGKLFDLIVSEFELSENNGEFYIDDEINNLSKNIFRLGQALTKISDLTFLNRARAESTFYEDLTEQLYRIIDSDKVVQDYNFPLIDNPQDYPIDYYIKGKHAPLFLFGIPNRDKARLTTITLERLLRVKADFDSLLIFSDQSSIPKQDLARLSNAGGEMIASLDAEEDISRKILRKVG
ncbi:DUF1828 domain-containing protein [Antarcticibacterium sp. 1MA-6-2]|uniref:DUF1828 domain-containing protein n=1 Tax=Antarcticibacterium sp. 1MA-6-2 TaxID=2908210 RepID=UPI001F3132AF|nr:DUF1828 domain-containing protein [Antarcticibacterium sp. 1MA-6-2]UJH92724.1 DUF1828 domain-containing protein [Antarcticibacterium sp. 1MA-6-2]